ncbi:MAG: tetratricopeptide repeat protein [Candidatus Latescibacteria bacterium]|jgi:uncharacterized membrane protein YjjB (DUF3815 family)|nr:tetratricopeptide repeat protein [Candidatus Latescibacterota bacterium]
MPTLDTHRGISRHTRMALVLAVLGVFVLIPGSTMTATAGTAAAARYNQANALYREGEYARAASAYEDVLGLGVRHGAVYYNLGNAYHKAGRLGQAILAYERALKLQPGDEDLAANLRFVNALKVDRDPEPEGNVAVRFLSRRYRSLSVDGIAVAFAVCLLACATVGVAWLFAPHRRVTWVCLLVACCGGLLFAGGLSAAKIHDREAVVQAVILDEETVGRSGPGSDYLKVFSLHEGTKVTVEREEGGWSLVRLPNGMGGWASSGAMEKI